jgi:hypothetical protein
MNRFEKAPSRCTGGGCMDIQARGDGVAVRNTVEYNGRAAYSTSVRIERDAWLGANAEAHTTDDPAEEVRILGKMMATGTVIDNETGAELIGENAGEYFSQADHRATAARMGSALVTEVVRMGNEGLIIDSRPFQDLPA